MALETNGSARLLVTVLLATSSFLAGTTLTLYARGDADVVKEDLQREITRLEDRYQRTLDSIDGRLSRLEAEARRDQARR